ncbi:MAG: phosphate ABC transporter substrate-binding protein, partial [Planctomycetota bacterium]|nr:phosphate ABC transporter substrate-binding protein [Planctomycetota bacterium]
MRTITKTAIALCSVLALSAFQSPAGSAADSTVRWKGCGITKKAFLKACAKAYTEETGIKVKVSGGGATKGIMAAGDGSADFGGTCRGCLPSLKENELGLDLALVAWDALVPVVHPSNPISDISKKDLIGVFTGKVTDWSQLGGTPGPISVLVRDGKTSGVGFTFRQIILGDKDFDFGDNVTRYKSSGPLEQQIEKNETAIGVTGMSSARLRKLKTLFVDGNEPSKKNIASGAYPYYRPLFLAHKKDIPAKERAFLNFILSD